MDFPTPGFGYVRNFVIVFILFFNVEYFFLRNSEIPLCKMHCKTGCKVSVAYQFKINKTVVETHLNECACGATLGQAELQPLRCLFLHTWRVKNYILMTLSFHRLQLMPH